MIALRYAARELRAGVRGLRIVLACLALGVGAIAAVGSLREGVQAGLASEGRRLLGGDLEVQTGAEAPPEALRAWLRGRGATLSGIVGMRSMLVVPGPDGAGGARQLVGKRLRLFTDLPLDEIERLEALQGSEINEAKIALANEATKMCRGEEAARSAQATAQATFAGRGLGEDLPTLLVPAEGVRLAAACTEIGFTASNGEAKRKVAEGAVKLDDAVMSDPNALITVDAGVSRKLSLGRKKHGILRSA